MPRFVRNYAREPRKPKKSKVALGNVISLRITDEERKALERLVKATSKNVSDIMREAMDLWSARRRKVCLD
ncbi:ribbon-helix-helix protein, CopG family [Geobacter sp. AOG2]|uniref:ribbon-helix-helix protein, CopG family n=1 Tax=Geobacter sp. AOG2 TaxID=1566347 RepID=UPI001CC7CFE9|nr:ribbon-helix-helix protein, CopG family [Geobacter sp. AOG2]GFE62538.1 hypothetical protein AOG2_31260 [Geobacter sp. AOG2]